MRVVFDYDIETIREFESRLEVFAMTVGNVRSRLDAAVRAEQSLWCDPQFDSAVGHILAANDQIGVALGSLYPAAMAFVQKHLEWSPPGYIPC